MMRNLFRLLKKRPSHPPSIGRHIKIGSVPSATYAIGDVHGCLDQLRALEQKIVADSAGIPGRKLLVMLGDYIDRGPNSAGVIDHLLARPPETFERICLMGNHEVMGAAFLDRPHPRSDWLAFGGSQTLQSYGLAAMALEGKRPARLRQLLDAHIPNDHRDFLRSLPWTLSLPGWLFVHAGLKPGIPLEDQHPDDLFWIRDEFFGSPGLPQQRIVHGHTPAADPVFTPARICIDTGAFATGRLTALKITANGETTILQSS